MPFSEILAEIAALQNRKKNPVIGIDGRAAAGKTTLAEYISRLQDCEVIHMDDFFLPPELRSKDRLSQVGGNVHYERFWEEVVKGICSRKPFTYRVFSCHEMDYVETRQISNSRLLVVEGSYSMREEFRKIYDYKIFLTLSDQLQKKRILQRNGLEGYAVFRDKWIPMENRYFEQCGIAKICDYCYEWQ